jgi:hypothetical protein
MRILLACLSGFASAAIGLASAHAAALGPTIGAPARPSSVIVTVEEKQERADRDCTPTNGPFGFYGNIWCQPPNEQSYLRNLGSRWPMETPPSLKNPKPSTSNSSDW